MLLLESNSLCRKSFANLGYWLLVWQLLSQLLTLGELQIVDLWNLHYLPVELKLLLDDEKAKCLWNLDLRLSRNVRDEKDEGVQYLLSLGRQVAIVQVFVLGEVRDHSIV